MFNRVESATGDCTGHSCSSTPNLTCFHGDQEICAQGHYHRTGSVEVDGSVHSYTERGTGHLDE